MSAEIEQAWATVLAAAADLTNAVAVVDGMSDPDPLQLAHLLAACRDAKRASDFAYKEVEKALIAAAGERQYEVAGLGLVEIKRAKKRSAWRMDEAIPAVVARIVDTPGVLCDEDGEIRPPHHIAEQVATRMRAAFGIYSGKVGGFKALGLTVGDYCDEEDGAYSVKLPSDDNEVVA
jgi:hypothetical protein